MSDEKFNDDVAKFCQEIFEQTQISLDPDEVIKVLDKNRVHNDE
jgi:hypothetical protein